MPRPVTPHQVEARQRFQVSEIRLRVDDRWLDVPLGPDTTLDVEAPGPAACAPGEPIGPGAWGVRGLGRFPQGVDHGARHDLEILADAGDHWCGAAWVDLFSGRLHGDGPLEACQGTRQTAPPSA